jgi:Reverse transcriptase (RNA-dependent DNA polymerase)
MDSFPSVFFKQDGDNQNEHAFRTFVGPKIIVTVYVDNILIIGKNRAVIDLFKKSLSTHFKIKNLGEAVDYLGIKIKQNVSNGTITLSQEAYVKNIIRKFELKNLKPVYMPVSPGLSVDLFNTSIPLLSAPMQTKYRSGIGSLTYAI